MPRTIVYPPRHTGGGETAGVPAPQNDYADRLAKYIPAEVISFFLLATALIENDDALLIIAVVVGVALTIIKHVASARSSVPIRQRRTFVFVLAPVAFLAWALGTSTHLQDSWGIGPEIASFVLVAAVFLIPALDELLTRSNAP